MMPNAKMKFRFIFLVFGIFTAAYAGSFSDPKYAVRIGKLSEITSQIGKYPHPKSEFFKSTSLLTELRRILDSDYKAYREHLSFSGAGMLEKEADYVCGDVSQLHVGGYGSLLFVNAKTEKMYLFWLKGAVLDKKYQIYGDRPIPAAVLESIEKHMNETCGHIATFKFMGELLVIRKTEKTEPNKALKPMPTSITPAAAQPSRQP
jgi:hypothetical protein